MAQKISRMQFLRGDIKGKHQPMRPPWAIPEEYFVAFCSRCDACIDVCFDHLIVKGRGGYPQMDFSREGCDFCEECLQVCEPGALKKLIANNSKHVSSQHNSNSASNTKNLNNSGGDSEVVVDKPDSYLPPWHLKAYINKTTCLSMQGTICRTCGESCDFEAIRFKLELGGVAEPLLDLTKCTGCGACYGPCPVNSITITIPEKQQAVT